MITSNETVVRDLARGRTGFFHKPSGTAVITKPGFEGSAFRPEGGLEWFLEVLE
ncbi:hypothetical protein [Sorangium cellulosum]|uniref:Uncharacterized protein n=1 Tax=Sorangium cellulosum So0157-2 TaxID=1254432 RepID=S4Y8P3_SORCE|nr:hypothetical protein [Sorangium cellulosum]AGP41249.1 hypothetical protein SCE1572_46225 [Sorangium cellulosum So0157-2]